MRVYTCKNMNFCELQKFVTEKNITSGEVHSYHGDSLMAVLYIINGSLVNLDSDEKVVEKIRKIMVHTPKEGLYNLLTGEKIPESTETWSTGYAPMGKIENKEEK